MYNRYIPQPDGSYRRSRVNDRQPESHPTPPPQIETDAPPPPPPPPSGGTSPRSNPRQEPLNGNVLGFLRQILPQNFDTGDLMVVLLLLLMSENRKDNTALLTLVIYLFL